MMRTRAAILAAASLILQGPIVSAQVTASLSPSVQNSASGQSLVFYGTLENSSTTSREFLNNAQVTVTGTAANFIVPGTNTFFANVPGILEPGESYTGEIFSVALSGSAPAADYAGTAEIQGGSDIFAGDALASADFKVLSPAVSIVATKATAAELGPVAGNFTVSRTGGTDIALTVAYAAGGSAVNGSTYDQIANTVVIPAGSSSAIVTITPIPDDIAEGTRTVTLTLSSSTSYDLGTAITDTVYVLDKPVDQWRFQTFGAAANSARAADMADWSGGGIVNLMAFALNIDPIEPDFSALPAGNILNGYPTLSYRQNSAATDVTFTVEGSTNLVTWSTTNIEEVNVPNAPPGKLTFQYVGPTGTPGRVFLRLRVTRTDR
jgi:hypothetical protein